MQEVTHPSVAQSNIVKQVDCCSRGNSRCKYILFLVQISVQINIARVPSRSRLTENPDELFLLTVAGNLDKE